MVEKDRPSVQRERIAEMVREVLDGCEANFDEKYFRNFVRFRIDHIATGGIASGPVTDHASVFADYEDDFLREFIRNLAPHYAKN